MKRAWRIVLIAVVVISFAVALSYPIIYQHQRSQNEQEMQELSRIRQEAMEEQEDGAQHPARAEADGETIALPGNAGGEESESVPDGVDASAPAQVREAHEMGIEDYLLDYVPGMTWRQVVIPEYEEVDAPVLIGGSKTIFDRSERRDALPYPMKEKVLFDPEQMLPELKEIYERNQDLVGWIRIEGTEVDYPVVQSEDTDFYLHHDFFGEPNENGQIILDPKCDPYTPSYNLVISGHRMRSGSMFGSLGAYSSQSYWESHKLVTFDTLMRRGTYVIFAAFYSADYDEDEEGFRYNANLQYRIDANVWLNEIAENALYDTEIPVGFGDEFITLTTCDHSRRDDGRFVLICRRLREGEEIA